MLKHLCQPIQIGNMVLKNRMVMPPMIMNYASSDGYVTERSKRYFQARAIGGVGLIIVEATYVHPSGQSFRNEIGISDDKFIPGLSELAKVVQRHGAKIAIQLLHGGRVATIPPDQPLLAPSPIPAAGRRIPQELTISEIKEIVNYFALAALRAKRAGIDGVEIHAAHSYLIAQFLSKESNQRTDAYGGSITNRSRILVEVIRAIKELTGPDYPVWCRINGREYGVEKGTTLEEAKETARLAEEAGAMALHVSAIGPESQVNQITPVFTPAVLADLAASIKETVKVPVIAVGKITPETGEKLVTEGKADLIAFGRALIADPELSSKVCENRVEDIRPCIFCLCCRDDLTSPATPGVGCSVNAAMGKEGELGIVPTEKSGRVLVVGGGPAGMEAARVAALRGHQVSLWEKEASLGGQLLVATIAPTKDKISQLIKYFRTQMKKLGIQVELNREATAAQIITFRPRAVVLAVGATPVVPQIPGLESYNAVQAVEVLEGKAVVGERVSIIGGELVGCEVAEYLAQKGKKVTIMRRGLEIAEKVGPNMRIPLLTRLQEKSVVMLTGITYNKVTSRGIILTDKEGKRKTIGVDTIVLAAGSVPDQGLYHEIKDEIASIYMVGDCVSPRTIRDAISEGYRVGLEI